MIVRIMSKSAVVWSLSLFTFAAILTGVFLATQSGIPSSGLSDADGTATLCAVQTALGKEYVMMYDVFGTTTPIPRDAERATLTPLPTSVSEGDATRGKAIFEGAGACNACHHTTDNLTVVGPSLQGIANVAASRVPNLNAKGYLRASILSTNEYIVKGFAEGVMPVSYEFLLQASEIDDVIAYLLTLK